MLLKILLVYLSLGLGFTIFGPAARSLRAEIGKGTASQEVKKWQIVVFALMLGSGIVILWPVLVPSAWRDERRKSLFTEIGALNKMLSVSNKDAIDADEFPNGVGEFGFSISNPIPCSSIIDSQRYLSRLTTRDGVKINYERIGSFKSDVQSQPVDGYSLEVNGRDFGTIYISPYQRRNSRKAPAGLRLPE